MANITNTTKMMSNINSIRRVDMFNSIKKVNLMETTNMKVLVTIVETQLNKAKVLPTIMITRNSNISHNINQKMEIKDHTIMNKMIRKKYLRKKRSLNRVPHIHNIRSKLLMKLINTDKYTSLKINFLKINKKRIKEVNKLNMKKRKRIVMINNNLNSIKVNKCINQKTKTMVRISLSSKF